MKCGTCGLSTYARHPEVFGTITDPRMADSLLESYPS